jgi:hypothetical protein
MDSRSTFLRFANELMEGQCVKGEGVISRAPRL